MISPCTYAKTGRHYLQVYKNTVVFDHNKHITYNGEDLHATTKDGVLKFAKYVYDQEFALFDGSINNILEQKIRGTNDFLSRKMGLLEIHNFTFFLKEKSVIYFVSSHKVKLEKGKCAKDIINTYLENAITGGHFNQKTGLKKELNYV